MIWIQDGPTRVEDAAAIAVLCNPLGIEQGRWDLSAIPQSFWRESGRTEPPATFQAQVLSTIREPLEDLKARRGYLTEDIVRLLPEACNEDLLTMFRQEHHHTDDEVRLVLAGAGVFGINPLTRPPFEIHVEQGDMIVVPAYTRHWFTLTDERFIVALRVFSDTAGWQAVYEPDAERHPLAASVAS